MIAARRNRSPLTPLLSVNNPIRLKTKESTPRVFVVCVRRGVDVMYSIGAMVRRGGADCCAPYGVGTDTLRYAVCDPTTGGGGVEGVSTGGTVGGALIVSSLDEAGPYGLFLGGTLSPGGRATMLILTSVGGERNKLSVSPIMDAQA